AGRQRGDALLHGRRPERVVDHERRLCRGRNLAAKAIVDPGEAVLLIAAEHRRRDALGAARAQQLAEGLLLIAVVELHRDTAEDLLLPALALLCLVADLVGVLEA